MPEDLYSSTCFECSKIITQRYSTSFSLGIRAFDARFRYPIYAVYGFVRYADEIVDTFHEHNKAELIAEFRKNTFEAIDRGISMNPVLQSFQQTVHRYAIEKPLIDAFLRSMEMDLDKTAYSEELYQQYIYGSAEVVGLMCLRIFCEGDHVLYDRLLPNAKSLGSAFQKINFLRDIRADYEERGRTYFPRVDFSRFSDQQKKDILADIDHDFNYAFEGIKDLPKGTRLGVYIAFVYYRQLFKKIAGTPAAEIARRRIRVSDTRKMMLFLQAVIQNKLNTI
ncbi:MAG: phytoene/squalene synthase family protein [Mucilaginibacter polytrichastri]|nr:phytoene/squalene synthase family protein [Mucilaginibacter polytrichastri]